MSQKAQCCSCREWLWIDCDQPHCDECNHYMCYECHTSLINEFTNNCKIIDCDHESCYEGEWFFCKKCVEIRKTRHRYYKKWKLFRKNKLNNTKSLFKYINNLLS